MLRPFSPRHFPNSAKRLKGLADVGFESPWACVADCGQLIVMNATSTGAQHLTDRDAYRRDRRNMGE
jgi:hypothetical protein